MSWAIWITGPPGSGKSTIARAVEAELRARGRPVARLELNEIRKVVTPEPRYSDDEREVVYRVVAYAAKLLTEAGVSVIVDAPASRKAWRQATRGMIPAFAEIRLVGPAATRPEREGEPDVTAGDEESTDAELTVRADDGDVARVVERVLLVTQRLAATGSGGRCRPVGGPGQRASRGDGGGPA